MSRRPTQFLYNTEKFRDNPEPFPDDLEQFIEHLKLLLDGSKQLIKDDSEQLDGPEQYTRQSKTFSRNLNSLRQSWTVSCQT